MTALAVHASHATPLSWPRIGAWSGSISLHLVILAFLLAPPVALQIARRAQTEPIVRFITPEVTKPEPPPPVPITKTVRTPVKPTTPPVVVAVATERTEMSQSVPAIEEAPVTNTLPASAVDTEPSPIGYGPQTKVPYPRDALLKGEHGTVTLRVLVGADGLPQTVEIEKSSGSRSLDRAALEAVKRWSFHASIRNGVAIAAWAKVPVTFNINQL